MAARRRAVVIPGTASTSALQAISDQRRVFSNHTAGSGSRSHVVSFWNARLRACDWQLSSMLQLHVYDARSQVLHAVCFLAVHRE